MQPTLPIANNTTPSKDDIQTLLNQCSLSHLSDAFIWEKITIENFGKLVQMN